jgi:hypothetical protein
MRRSRTAEQKPKDGTGVCPFCGGKGRLATQWKTGKRERTKTCIHCRGTGKANGGYLTK